MTVIFYDHGQHDTGFVGFRVARTIGTNGEYRQKYFSLNKYSYGKAARLAHDLNDKWEAEASAVKHIAKLAQRRRSWGPNVIVNGLRAVISVERKIRGGQKRAYFSASFNVKKIGCGKGDIAFRTSVHGYEGAFELAVIKYSEIHSLSDTERLELLSKIPSPTVFTGYLLDRLHSNGHQVSAPEIADRLTQSNRN